MSKKIRKNAWVVFKREGDAVSRKLYNDFYKAIFEEPSGDLKLFIYLGEVPQAPGHCILADLDTGLITGLWHTDDFREATEDEC